MTTVNQPMPLDLEKGWMVVQKSIAKLKETLEGEPPHLWKAADSMEAYNTVYDLCTQKLNYGDYCSQQLYDRYRENVEDYMSSTVLPRLREKRGEFLLEELVQRWSNHKTMVRWLCFFFQYLDRFFIPRKDLPTLTEVGLSCFRDKVCDELNGEVVDAVITLYEQEREEAEKIDRALHKSFEDVVSLFNQERDEGKVVEHGALLKNVAGVFGFIVNERVGRFYRDD